MDGLVIRKVDSVTGPHDLKGPVFNWNFPNGPAVVILVRKAGTKFAGHYHSGADPSKNPERMFLAKGELIAVFRRGPNGVREKRILVQGDSWEVSPGIEHACFAVQDCVILEFRLTHFDSQKPDTFPATLEVR